ncbi:MAG: ABC transporter ATP-binding protein [Candidatus Cloacimonetes bacterium]|nr:ABC transporter ATP-binding protein [Candidatus Cloacimonadota bacterium]
MNAISFQNVTKQYRIGKSVWPTLRDRFDYLLNRTKNIFVKKSVEEYDSIFLAIDDVSFDLEKGGSLGIIGPNGAGKSTILKLLAGVTKPTSGEIQTKGKVAAMIELGAGLHPELTGRENIYLYGAIMGMDRDYVESNIRNIIDFAELEHFIDTPLKRYSSGMQARLGFAVTAHIDADILLIDEVLSVGDIRFQFKCAHKLAEYQEMGITIIFVSHNLESVRKLCNRTILLNNGHIERDGPTDECIREYYTLMAEDRVRTSGTDNKINEEVERRAKIQRIELLNEKGEPSRDFISGEKAVLRLEIECFDDLPNPRIGFFIRTTDRNVILDTNSALLQHEIGMVNRGTILIAEFKLKMNLLRGTYSIGNHVEYGRGGSYYDYVDPSVTFTVNENYSHYGVVDISPVFKFLKT